MVLDLIWAKYFLGHRYIWSPEIWFSRNLVPKKLICRNRISRAKNFLGQNFLGPKRDRGPVQHKPTNVGTQTKLWVLLI